jgi:3-oxoacyl-[acyl-carrier-protein] synthase III
LVTQKVDPNKINYIIYTKGSLVNQSDKNMPYYIQHKFGFSNAIVFSLEQECCTSLLAVNILDMLLKQDGSGKGIILTSNFFPTLESRLMGLFVVSDAVGLIEMSYEDHGFEIIYFDSTTDGSITNAQDFTNQAEKVVSVGANLILKTLYKNSLTIEDVFSIIPQNTNLSGWNAYFEKLCMAPEKLFKDNFGWLGHWGDVDFVRNITDIHQSKVQAPIDSVFLAYALGTGTSLDVLLLKNK